MKSKNISNKTLKQYKKRKPTKRASLCTAMLDKEVLLAEMLQKRRKAQAKV
jgi:hypothetical protein